jgi:uncharacterized cupredoxin-like copper-binding protein
MHLRPALLVLALAVVPALTSGCGTNSSANPPSDAGAVHAALGDYRIATSTTDPATSRVTFAVRNVGKVKHEFVVLQTNKPAASLGDGKRVPETGHVGELGDLRPGQSKRLTLRLKPGHYALICNLPGHYAAGMHQDFTVR